MNNDLLDCSIGNYLNSKCHVTSYTNGKTELIDNSTINNSDKELLHWRTGIALENLENVCLHHNSMYLGKRFENAQVKCTDPFQKHKVKVRGVYITCIS